MSSSNLALSVRGLSKRYTLAHTRPQHTLASEALFHGLKHLGKNLGKSLGRKQHTEEFWALRDVSFDIHQGDVVGIIGRNGAGKSTLLKILSRITEPSSGQIDLYGRVGSLLEVGTGFHPELTGRENIFLNGAILGMSRREIGSHFEAIVEFSGTSQFLDTPVKRYSSGMYVRLAFAVAAHLEPEILIVDEVLAVGDAEFQRKCLGKMQDVAAHGRTVIFVSHNMAAVNRLCRSCLWMEKGQLKMIGPTDNVVADYLMGNTHMEGERKWSAEDAPGNEKARLRAVRILNSDYLVTSIVDIRKTFFVEIDYDLHHSFGNMRAAIQIVTGDGTSVLTSSDTGSRHSSTSPRAAGFYTSRCEIPGELLNSGQYSVTASSDIPMQEVLFLEENALSFSIEKIGGVSGHYDERWPGVVCPNLEWHVTENGKHISKNLSRA